VAIRTVLIQQNPHLRRQLTQTIEHKGLTLAGSYEHVNDSSFRELAAAEPDLVIVDIKCAHAQQWRLVRALRALPVRPLLMAVASMDLPGGDLPGGRESALRQGIDYIFDPLLEVDGLLAALGGLPGRETVAEAGGN